MARAPGVYPDSQPGGEQLSRDEKEARHASGGEPAPFREQGKECEIQGQEGGDNRERADVRLRRARQHPGAENRQGCQHDRATGDEKRDQGSHNQDCG